MDKPESSLRDEQAELLPGIDTGGIPRREFIRIVSSGSAGVFGTQLLAEERAYAEAAAASGGKSAPPVNARPVNLDINGTRHELALDPRVTLLDALREHAALTGSKKGCDHGHCGACTVIVDGRRVLSCLTLAAQAEGMEITTVEGMATDDALHPVQEAFIEHDGFQCGYCTPGQICSAVALLDELKRGDASFVTEDITSPGTEATDAEIRERMSGNICRCAAYPQILAAIREVHSGKKSAHSWRFAEETELALIRHDFPHDPLV